MECVGVFRKFFPQFVILFLPLRFFGQFNISLLDNLLQISPSVLQRFHREPCIGIGAHVEVLNLLIQRCQSLTEEKEILA